MSRWYSSCASFLMFVTYAGVSSVGSAMRLMSTLRAENSCQAGDAPALSSATRGVWIGFG